MRLPRRSTVATRAWKRCRCALPSPKQGQATAAADSAGAPTSLRPFLLRLDRLSSDQAPDLVHLLDELLGLEDVGIVLVESRIDNGLHATRSCRHDGDALGEINRLLHVMGHEDHGLRRALPDAQ